MAHCDWLAEPTSLQVATRFNFRWQYFIWLIDRPLCYVWSSYLYILLSMVYTEEMLHEVQMYSQITPMEIDILFQLTDCRHPDGSDTSFCSYLSLF